MSSRFRVAWKKPCECWHAWPISWEVITPIAVSMSPSTYWSLCSPTAGGLTSGTLMSLFTAAFILDQMFSRGFSWGLYGPSLQTMKPSFSSMSSSSLLWQGALSHSNTMLSMVNPAGRLLSMSCTQDLGASVLNAPRTHIIWTTWTAEMAPIIWMFLPFDAGLTATALFPLGALPGCADKRGSHLSDPSKWPVFQNTCTLQ